MSFVFLVLRTAFVNPLHKTPERIKTSNQRISEVCNEQNGSDCEDKRCGVNQHSIPANQSEQGSEQVVKEVIHNSYLQILFRVSLYPLYRIKLYLSSPIFKFNKKIFIPDFSFYISNYQNSYYVLYIILSMINMKAIYQ